MSVKPQDNLSLSENTRKVINLLKETEQKKDSAKKSGEEYKLVL